MEKLLTPSFENVNCDICQKNNYSIFMEIPDYEQCLHPAVNFSIVKCKSCGLLYTNPRFIEPEIRKLSGMQFTSSCANKPALAISLSSLIRKHPKLRMLYHNITGEYLSEIIAKSRGKVLDVGCGYGDLMEDLTQKGCDAYGTEINPVAVQACRQKGLNVRLGALDEISLPEDYFDTVILRHVIEHFSSPKLGLREAYRVLKPQGQLFIYCPNADNYISRLFGKYWYGWVLPFHFYHFSVKTMENLIGLTEFKIKKIRTVTPDYIFFMSINRYSDNKGNRFLLWIRKKGIFTMVFFRLFLGAIFRILDLFMPQKGECLRVELIKPLNKK